MTAGSADDTNGAAAPPTAGSGAPTTGAAAPPTTGSAARTNGATAGHAPVLRSSSAGISKPRRGGGRPAAAVWKYFTEEKVNGTVCGSRCLACGEIRSDKQRNPTNLAKHAYHCPKMSFVDKLSLWTNTRSLQKFPKPVPIRAVARTSSEDIVIGNGLGLLPGILAEEETDLRDAQDAGKRTNGATSREKALMKNFVDRISPQDIEEIRKLILRFFVANNIAFSIAECETFSALLKKLRPAFVYANGLPSRYSLSGPYLDALYEDVKQKVDAYIKAFLDAGGKMTLVLDGWDNTNRSHVVNLICVLKEAAVFLDSVVVGEENQTAEAQASLVRTVIEPYGAAESFAAVGSDNTSSCLNMRQIVADTYPGIVSLNDQSHVANLAISDICKTPFCKRVLEKVLVINNFIMNHQYVLAAYRRLMDKFNAGLRASGGASSSEEATSFVAAVEVTDCEDDEQSRLETERTSVNFTTVAKTRFGYRVDIAERCLRNKKVVQEMVDDVSYLRSKIASSPTAKAALNEFLAVVDNRQTWKEIKTLLELLTPMRVYLRAFDKDSMDLTVVYPKTIAMVSEYEKLLNAVKENTESSCAKSEATAIMKAIVKRTDGPLDQQVRVTLLQDIHYLAAAVNPLTPGEDFADLTEPALNAFRNFMANSSVFFTEDVLRDKTENERCQMFYKDLMEFFSGKSPRFVFGRKNFTAGCDIAGFWTSAGKDTPLLSKVGEWISFLSASSCAVERSFSAQKAIHSKTRNRLLSERVRKLMFVRWNLRLLAGFGPEVADAIDELATELDAAIDEAEEEGEDAVEVVSE